MVVTIHGFRMMGNSSMSDGTFEPEETLLISECLQQAEVFVDIGANIGYYTCIARNACRKTLAFEPLELNLKYLNANLVANGWDDVEVYPLGLSDKPGVAVLYGGSTGASLINGWADASPLLRRMVPLSTLDIILGERFSGKTILIKVDIEGAEYRMLEGAVRILAVTPSPIWVMEITMGELHPDGFNPNFSKTFEIFWKNGYRAQTADALRREVTPADLKRWIEIKRRDFGGSNYLFTKLG